MQEQRMSKMATQTTDVPQPLLPKERVKFECFKSISLDGFCPIEMLTCATCQHNNLCAECGKRRRTKLMMKRK